MSATASHFSKGAKDLYVKNFEKVKKDGKVWMVLKGESVDTAKKDGTWCACPYSKEFSDKETETILQGQLVEIGTRAEGGVYNSKGRKKLKLGEYQQQKISEFLEKYMGGPISMTPTELEKTLKVSFKLPEVYDSKALVDAIPYRK